MPSLTSNYLLPAIILNPAFILHLINTFVSRTVPQSPAISQSPHPFMESIGPVPGSTLYMDMHANDQLCWRYTAFMVVVQLIAFGGVSDKRGRRKARKAAILEREKLRREKTQKQKYGEVKFLPQMGVDSYKDGTCDASKNEAITMANGKRTSVSTHLNGGNKTAIRGEESAMETSEEEMML